MSKKQSSHVRSNKSKSKLKRVVYKWPITANSCLLTPLTLCGRVYKLDWTPSQVLVASLLWDDSFYMNVEWNDVGMAHNMLIKSIFLSDWTQKGRQTGFPFPFHCSNV